MLSLSIAMAVGAVGCASSSELSTQGAEAGVGADEGEVNPDAELGEGENAGADTKPDTASSESADNSTGAEQTRPAFEKLLLPTWLPDGWEQHSNQSDGSQLSISYGEPGTEPPLTLLVSQPDDRALNLEAIHRRDLTEGAWINVRGGADNAVLVTSFEDGSDTIAFIEEGLLYQVISQDNALPDQGRRFVEGLAVPLEPDPEKSDSEDTADPGGSDTSTDPSDQVDPGEPASEKGPTESKGGPGDIDK